MPNNVNKGAFVTDIPVDGPNPMMDWTEKPGKSKKKLAGDDLEFTELKVGAKDAT